MLIATEVSIRRHQLGLSLIEMMVALVVGLVVSGAALALVAAVTKSNSETIRATGLTQELRTTSEIIARDLRRARNVSDPIANVSSASLVACNTIDISTAGCVSFAYDCSSASNGTFKSIGLVGNKVWVRSGTSSMQACPDGTGTNDIQLSTDAIKINAMTFTQDATHPDAYTLQLTGQFLNDPSATSPLVRTISQEIQIRSSAVVK